MSELQWIDGDQEREAVNMLILHATDRARDARSLMKVAPADAKIQGRAYFLKQAHLWDRFLEMLSEELPEAELPSA